MSKRSILPVVLILTICLTLISGCRSTRHVPEGSYLLDKVKISIDSTGDDVTAEELTSYLRQQPNHKMLWSMKLRLGIFNMSGNDTTKWWNRWIRKLGEPPVIYSEQLTTTGVRQLSQALKNKGYLTPLVEADTISSGKKMRINYKVSPGRPHIVENIYYSIEDSVISNIIIADSAKFLIKKGDNLDLNQLDLQRELITRSLRNRGYYDFLKENIRFEADTTSGSDMVELTMIVDTRKSSGISLRDSLSTRQHRYYIRKVYCLTDYQLSSLAESTQLHYRDSVNYKDMTIYYGNQKYLRPSVIYENNFIIPGKEYSENSVDQTYKAFSRLEILKFINIRFLPVGTIGDLELLDAYILLTPGQSQTMSAELEGTNSAGDLGVAAAIGYSHRNIGKGSETFSAKLRGAYESISGNLDGLIHNRYMEYSLDLGLQFPKFKAPFLTERFKRRINASTELHLSMNYQERPEYTRIVSTAGWSYKWTQKRGASRHTVTPIDINYVYLPASTNDFINQIAPDNPLLRYSYEDHFIMRAGYSFYHTNKRSQSPWQRNPQTNIYTIRGNAEFAGNLLFLFSSILAHRSNFHQNPYKIFGIHYSQYFKFDSDFGYTHVFDSRQSIATHLGLGIGVPYGNSSILPFEKRFYGGGSNGVRGWAVRTLGPGEFPGNGIASDFMNKCGDIRFIMSAEYRAKLFWLVELGVFIDVGNIWTIRNYTNQPGGFFQFDTFYKQLAAAYGLGVRLDFDYFLLRFDLGMKAHNPALGAEPWPLIHPRWGRDRAFHFSIGYPF